MSETIGLMESMILSESDSELDDIRWNTQSASRHKGHDEYRGYLLEKHHDGSLRLVLDLAENAVITGHGTKELQPFAHNTDNTHAIYIDIKRNTP